MIFLVRGTGCRKESLYGLSSVEQYKKPYECYTNWIKGQYWDFILIEFFS